MATTINASSSSNGLIASGDASGNLALQGNGTTGLTVNSSGKLIMPNIALGTASAGMLEYDGITHYFTPASTQRGVVPGMQYYRLENALAGANATGTQSLFGVGCTLSSSTVYNFELSFTITKTAGTNLHVINLGYGGTATLNNILWNAKYTYVNGALGTLGVTNALYDTTFSTASLSAVTTSSATLTLYLSVLVKGTVSVGTGGTFIPQYSLSAAPGGAYTTNIGSYVLIYPIGASGSNTNVGTWA